MRPNRSINYLDATTKGGALASSGLFTGEDYTASTDLSQFDFLGLDAPTLANPYPFFRALREQAPVFKEPHQGVYLVTRYDDVVSVARRPEVFSSIVAATGPMSPLPDLGAGSSVSERIQHHRDHALGANMLLTLDPPVHPNYRSLVNKLFSPRRMREVENYVVELADELIDEFIDAGSVEFIDGFAGPFPFLVVADLLGVPREDHAEFKRRLRGDGEFRIGNPNADQSEMGGMSMGAPPDASEAGGVSGAMMGHIFEYFSHYITDRQQNPRDDVMSEIATATFPGTDERPSIADLLGLAFILFGAGQETTVRLFTTGMQILLERPDIMAELRKDPLLTEKFVEETLRFDTPVKGLFRVAREDAEIGDVTVPAGAIVMLLWGAGNRDPEQFEDPETFDLHRHNANRTLSFGHGIHYCVGAPLARLEGKIGWQAILRRMDNIRRADDTDYDYITSFIIRGLNSLNLEFDPVR